MFLSFNMRRRGSSSTRKRVRLPPRRISVSGTRIASISGLRGLVGDGLDPVVAVEFAAAYASQCEPGAVVVSHDGRISSSVFVPAVVAGVTATGRDALLVGATATPTVGILVRERQAVGGIQLSASHNPPQYNGLKFFQPRGMVLSPAQGRAVLDRWQRKDFHWVSWDCLGQTRTVEEPEESHLRRVLEIVDAEAIRRRGFVVVLDACHGSGGRLARSLLWSLGCKAIVLGGDADGRYDHLPEPTEKNLREFSAIVPAVGADVGFAQDPDADRLAIIDENGRYIGEELTLALAALRRLDQAQGPVVLNLSTSRVTEELARKAGCPVVRTPVGEINVVEAMLAENALLGGEGNGGVIDPRIGLVRDSFVGMALVLDLLATSDQPLSRWVGTLPSFVMVKDQYLLAPGTSSPVEVAALWDRIARAHPEARADRRDGLRLDWEDRWVHVRSSNTEPIVRVIVEAPDTVLAHTLANQIGRWVNASRACQP
jgi:phosphomannomutase